MAKIAVVQSPALAEPAAPKVEAVVVPPPAPTKPIFKDEVRAALLVPLTGPYSATGTVLSNAAQLALFEVADQRFNLIPLDTKGTPEGAAAAAKLALAQGADIILGPVFSGEVKAAAPVAREQMVPMLAFTTDRSAIGTGVYSLGILPGPQMKRMVLAALADNRAKFAVLAPNTESGHIMTDAFRAAVQEVGAKMVRVDYYEPSAADLTPLAKRFAGYEARKTDLERDKKATVGRSGSQQALAAMDGNQVKLAYDAVLLPDDGVRLKSVASLITYFGIDPGPVRFLGTMQWDDPRLADEPSLQGGWYPAPSQAAHAEFEARYTKAFGAFPQPRLGSFASIAYDAAALAAALARQGQGDYSVAALTNPNGFAGVDGVFRLLPDGTSERGLAVRELARGGSKEVQQAPASFQGSTN